MNNKLTDIFIAFREQCIWLRICYNTYTALYESDDDIKQILTNVADIFFRDLNAIFIEYIWLQICKITDPAGNKKHPNLTTNYINGLLENSNLMTDEIKGYSINIDGYRKILIKARNKLVAHLDAKSVLNNRAIGEHKTEEVQKIFEDLQKYCDAVGTAIGAGPLDFSVIPGNGDVTDFIMKLKQYAHNDKRHMNHRA